MIEGSSSKLAIIKQVGKFINALPLSNERAGFD